MQHRKYEPDPRFVLDVAGDNNGANVSDRLSNR